MHIIFTLPHFEVSCQTRAVKVAVMLVTLYYAPIKVVVTYWLRHGLEFCILRS